MSGDTPTRAGGRDLERFQRYFEDLPCFVTVQSRDLRVLDANERFRTTFGVGRGAPDSEASQAYCWELYKGRATQCVSCPVEETFESGAPLHSEETVRAPDGSEFPVAVYTAPIRDERGEVARVLKVSADISGVKQLQLRLHNMQRRYQRLFNEVPCYVSVQDRDLKVTAANRAFLEDFGDEIGEKCYALYKHRSEPCLHCPVVKTFEDGQSHRSEEVVTSLGGERYNVLVQTQPLRDERGQVTHVMEMSTNITELRQLQDQLTSLGLLVGSISHDLKGLITAMDGGMYLMDSGFKRGDQGRLEEGWDMVKRNIGRIRSMVLDILHYAKDRELEAVPVDVSTFTGEIHRLMAAKANALDIEFESLVDPECGEIEVDEGAIRSALINVVENAFDACRVDMKKQDHRVRLEVNATPDEVLFTVQDNGIGMDRETRERLFSLFFSSKGAEGTGLGLFISHKIVAQHGGRIEVTSSLDVGSRFVVRIPRQLRPQRAVAVL